MPAPAKRQVSNDLWARVFGMASNCVYDVRHLPADQRIAMKTEIVTKQTRLNVRASAQQKKVIEKAARLLNTTVSSFVLQRAVEDAQAILAEQHQFRLPKKQWDAFCKALDTPPRDLPALRKLLKSKGVFDA